MPYSNSSLAHDYSSHEYREDQQVRKKNKTRKISVVKKQEKPQEEYSLLNTRNIVTFFVLVVGICFMLLNQVKLNEVNREISSLRTEIVQMESESVRMQSSLESSLSLRNVSRQAEQELGLQHIDQYQIEYVCIYEDDFVEIVEPETEDGFSDNVETFFADILHQIKAVFGAE